MNSENKVCVGPKVRDGVVALCKKWGGEINSGLLVRGGIIDVIYNKRFSTITQ